MRMIIDTDAGIDDAQAILMALTYPGVTVEAITTVTGNVHVDKVVPNVFTILDIMNRDIPVYRGADQPVLGDTKHAEYVHGGDGLGNLKDRPITRRKVQSEHAALALIRLANEAPGEYTLVALGPLTNIALAVRLDPELPKKLKQFVFMGGTIAGRGNTEIMTAEFNIYGDPEAAYMTLQSFPESTMVSWETTLYHPLTSQQYEELLALDTPAARFSQAITAELRQRPNRLDVLLPDPLAMAVALEASLIRKSEFRYVTTELQGIHTRGQTVVDYRSWSSHTPNVHVVTEIDMDGFYRLLKQSLS
jgi:purine nucleosidase